MPNDPLDDLFDAPAKRASNLPRLIDFAKRNKLAVGSTTGGRHNTGSKHYSGNAIDIRGSGAFDDATVTRLKAAAAAEGFLLRDERRRPPRQKVWGGPHVHIEVADRPTVQDPLNALFDVPETERPRVAAQAPARTQGRGAPAQPTQPLRRVRAGAPSRSLFGRMADVAKQPKISLPDLKRADEVAIKEMLRPRMESYLPEVSADALRVAKGDQPADPLTYSRAQDLVRLTEPRRTEISSTPEPPAFQARQRSLSERIGDVVRDYAPGIRSLDTPMGIKTDPIRGALSLGVLDLRREVSPEEKLIDPQAEAKAETAYQVGSFAPAVVPYVAAGKLVSKIPSLAAATREAHIARSALTFGGVELGREVTRAAQTGEPLNPKEVAISTAIGAGIGGLAGVNPGLKKQLVAFITPGVVADVARGTDPQTATFNALTNLAFGLHSYRDAPRNVRSAARAATKQLGVQTVPESVQRQLRVGEVTTQLPEGAELLNPADVALNRRPRIRLRGEGRETQATETGESVVPTTSQLRSENAADQPSRTADAGVRLRSDARSRVEREAQSTNIPPIELGGRREIPTETQPNVETQPAGEKPAGEGVAAISSSRRSEPQQPVSDVRSGVPETVQVKPQWQHRDFGLVSESPDQSGVGRGRVRVVTEDGSEHVIQRPKGTGAGNQIAIPVRDATAKPPVSEGAAQAGGGRKPPSRSGEKQPWEQTREDWFNDTESVKVSLGKSTASGFAVKYDYINPSSAGPFSGSDVLAKKPTKGEEINASFGRARVTSVSNAKTKDVPLAARYDEAKAFHRREVETALREGKPVPRAVLEDYPDLAARQGGPTEPAAPRPSAVTPPAEGAAKATSSPAPPKEMSFTQFAKSRGYPSDYDVLEHGLLGPSGRMSKRAKDAAMSRHLERARLNEQAHREFEDAIRRGEVVDTEASTFRRVTKDKLDKAEVDAQRKSIQSEIDRIDSRIKLVAGLGRMSHLPSGKLKRSYQREFDDISAKRAELVRQLEAVNAPAPVKPTKPSEQKSLPAQAKPAQPPEPPPSTTSARKAQMAGDRSELDLPQLPPAERKSWRESLAEAKPESANRLADEVLSKPRALSDSETASVVVRAQQVKNEHAAKMAEIGAATDADAITAKRNEAAALEAEFDKLTTAAKASGTEKGRALAAQKLTINQDFDLVSVKARLKAAKGRPLTEKEDARVEQMVKERDQAIKERDAAIEKARLNQIDKEIQRVQRQRRRVETKEALDAEAITIKQNIAAEFARLKSRQGQTLSQGGLGSLDPEGVITRNLVKYVRNRVRANVGIKAEQLLDDATALIQEFDSRITRQQIADLISGYKMTAPEPQPADVQRLREIRSEIRRIRAQEDVAAGIRTERMQGPRRFEARQLPAAGPSRRFVSRNERRLKQLEKQETELARRLEERDFSKPERPEPLPYTREVARQQSRVDEIDRQFKREEYRATRSTGGKITDELAKAAGVGKTIKSMGDISAVFRQGGFYAVTHPVRGLALPFRDMVRSFTDAGYRTVESAIKFHPKFEQARKDGVDFTGIDKNDPNLSKHEEGYLGREYLDYIPIAKQVSRFSERTYVSFLDSQRMNMYDVMTDGLTNPSRISRLLGARGGLTAKELAADTKRIAQAINSATGRGNLSERGRQIALPLNIAMFSPRLLKSRVELLNNMLNPVAIARMPRNARAQIIQDNVKFLSATVGVMTLAKSLGGDVNFDPDSGDFLKIRFGSTTYDTLTGLQQPFRYLLNMARAMSPVDSRILQAGDYYAGQSPWEMTVGTKTRGGFLESKASPLVSNVVESVRGTDFLGRKRTKTARALDFVTPLPAGDVIEAFKQEGLLGSIKTLPSLTGISVNTYPPPAEPAKTIAEKLTRRLIRREDTSRTEEEMDASRAVSDLRARSRRGEDVSAEIKTLPERQQKSIAEARGQTRLQQDFKRLSLENALTVWGVATEAERAQIKPLLADKADAVDNLDPSKQESVKAQLRAIGIVPIEELPAERQAEIRRSRRAETREQARARYLKERADRQAGKRRSAGYGY